ncbi:MAG: Zn-ribbon domain-containing OB-fold protein [candidate division WOR-3 bacterium]
MLTAKDLMGTGLSSQDFKQKKILTEKWTANAKYGWDCGIAIGRYLSELKNGRIIGIKCHKCNRIVVPPRIFCEWCFKPMDEWVYLKDTGTVNTFSLCYVAWNMERLTEPQIPAVIEIDGASPGMGIMHLISEIDPKKVTRGMKVKAVWRPENERTGAITDIKYWKPVK